MHKNVIKALKRCSTIILIIDMQKWCIWNSSITSILFSLHKDKDEIQYMSFKLQKSMVKMI